jgi:hypothetical protein
VIDMKLIGLFFIMLLGILLYVVFGPVLWIALALVAGIILKVQWDRLRRRHKL